LDCYLFWFVASTQTLSGTHLLVVEDDEAIRNTLAELLHDEGALVATAIHGKDALRELRQSAPPDLILLDLMMPVMDGWEFRLEQKSDAALARIPLIAMSADMSAKARAIAADAYIRKPIDFNGLVGRIRNVVDQATKQRRVTAERMAALSTLAAGIAHEINNPLTFVMANLQVLADKLRTGQLRDDRGELGNLVSDTLEGADRIRQIVKQAQMVAPVQRPGDAGVVDLRVPLQSALDRVEPQARGRAALVRDLGGPVWVRGDRGPLEELFYDLLCNAFQAIPAGRESENEVRITMQTLLPDRVAVDVADTGVGIKPATGDRVFQPFFTTRPVGQGVGLGLAICRGIVTALGGEISFESELDRGTTFRVLLPTTAPPVPPAGAQ
jgi:two-component system, NtrC family, sensor kinase